ncbi:hypothetical protein JQ596_23620 [Bradyrhizobium manausense]|nr:hypothetical protein [Bradyrhizobium manausense]
MTISPQLWSFTEKHQRYFKFNECLAAGGQSGCESQIIRTHIVPRSELKHIAQDGHVVAVPTSLLAIMKMQRTGLKAKEIGVGEFSTMNCFCAGHDNDTPLVFSPRAARAAALWDNRCRILSAQQPAGVGGIRVFHVLQALPVRRRAMRKKSRLLSCRYSIRVCSLQFCTWHMKVPVSLFIVTKRGFRRAPAT